MARETPVAVTGGWRGKDANHSSIESFQKPESGALNGDAAIILSGHFVR